jgi:hypothetical protein
VQPEVIEIRFGTSGELRKLGVAANAGPHAAQCTPTKRRRSPGAAARGIAPTCYLTATAQRALRP